MNNVDIKISEIGRTILEKLAELDKTQTWLANECKVTRCHISMLIYGKTRASNILLWKLSKILELDFDRLSSINKKSA